MIGVFDPAAVGVFVDVDVELLPFVQIRNFDHEFYHAIDDYTDFRVAAHHVPVVLFGQGNERFFMRSLVVDILAIRKIVKWVYDQFDSSSQVVAVHLVEKDTNGPRLDELIAKSISTVILSQISIG